jgi:biotin operon repressor
MTQAERDRLVALKKAKKKLITQKEAAQELGITERHVRRLLRQLKRRGDKVEVHGLRGLASKRQISVDTEQEAVAILLRPVYRGFGPTLASKYLAQKHEIDVSRETVRQWMIRAKLWRARKQHVEKVHEWRPRRSRLGELVQWDTSDHDWLEGRGDLAASATSERPVGRVDRDATLTADPAASIAPRTAGLSSPF